MFSKIDVNFSSAHPLWVFLKEKQGGFMVNAIKWNFTKFIIDKEGVPVARLGPKDSPIPHVENAIKKLFWASSAKLLIDSNLTIVISLIEKISRIFVL